MPQFSQNKKVAITVVSIFLISFALMSFFLTSYEQENAHYQASVLHDNAEDSKHTDSEEVSPYEKYVENQTSPTFVINYEGKFLFATENFCSMIQYNCSDIQGELLFNFINTKDLAHLVSVHSGIVQKREELKGIGPFRIQSDSGESIVMFDIQPLLEDGELHAMIFVVNDITETVKELQLNNESNDEKKQSYDTIADNRDSKNALKQQINTNIRLIRGLF